MRPEFIRLSGQSHTYGAWIDSVYAALIWQQNSGLWRVVLFFPGHGPRPVTHRADIRGGREEAERAAVRRIASDGPPGAFTAHQRIALALSVGPETRETLWDVYR